MDIIKKIDKIVPEEATVTGDVAQNTAKGSVDVVGGDCPDGYHYCEKRKKCIKDGSVTESVVVAAVVGSGQTRAVGAKDKYVSVVKRQPRPLKFSKLLGAYIPPEEDEEEIIPGEPEEVDEGLFSDPLKKYFEMAKKSWHGLDIEMGKKQFSIMAGTKRQMDSVYDWAKDKMPIKFKIIKNNGTVTIKM
jgi:hypothetical protein